MRKASELTDLEWTAVRLARAAAKFADWFRNMDHTQFRRGEGEAECGALRDEIVIFWALVGPVGPTPKRRKERKQ